MSEFKKLEAIFHSMFDEDGKLYPLKSYTNEKGVKTYYMKRPQPAKNPESPVCSLHVYELVIGFQHDVKRCRFCNQEEPK